jgi:putative transposase
VKTLIGRMFHVSYTLQGTWRLLTSRIGAEWNEHTETRTALRNGHRDKTLTTQAGDLDLAIPKLRSGSFFPSLLERRRRIDQALFAVIMEAYVHGASTRSVDDLVKALGADSGISKSEVHGSARTSIPS